MLAPVAVGAAQPLLRVEEFKRFCRVDHGRDDIQIETLIDAVMAELAGPTGSMGRALATQSWRQDYDGFAPCLYLPVGPVQSLTGIEYSDAADAAQTLSPGVYVLSRSDDGRAHAVLQPGQSPPATYRRADAVRVTYVAGFAADDPLLAKYKLAVTMLAEWYYDTPDEPMPPALDRLIKNLSRITF